MDTTEYFTEDSVDYCVLYCQCPTCIASGHPSIPVYWKHDECRGQIYIGDETHV